MIRISRRNHRRNHDDPMEEFDEIVRHLDDGMVVEQPGEGGRVKTYEVISKDDEKTVCIVREECPNGVVKTHTQVIPHLTTATVQEIDIDKDSYGGYLIQPADETFEDKLCIYCELEEQRLIQGRPYCDVYDQKDDADSGDFTVEACGSFSLDKSMIEEACCAGLILGDYNDDVANQVFTALFADKDIDKTDCGMSLVKSKEESAIQILHNGVWIDYEDNMFDTVEDEKPKVETKSVKLAKKMLFRSGKGADVIFEKEEEIE